MARLSLSSVGSFTSVLGSKVVLMGVSPSKPFAADQGRLRDLTLDWRLQAVMSMVRLSKNC